MAKASRVMILHNKYTITLNRCSQMFETLDTSLLLRFGWLPKFLITPRFEKFMIEFNELFNSKEIDSFYEDSFLKLKIFNKVNNLLPALYYGLVISDNKTFLDTFKEMYGKDYEGFNDLELIINEIKRLNIKAKDMFYEEEKKEKRETLSLEKLITNTEAVLERSIDRTTKLFQFKHQYDLAVQRAKEFEKLKNKHG